LKTVVVTQRVSVASGYGERRDCLDQAWSRFLLACDLLPRPVPNVPEVALQMCGSDEIAGLLLTGGNDLVAVGGDAPERDAVEEVLLKVAEQRELPVLGVCRGMQVIQQHWGIPLHRVEGHVTRNQTIRIDGQAVEVNSYHRFGAFESRPPLEVWAVADDGVIKAVRHSTRNVVGVMCHPERYTVPAPADVALFRRVFGVS
jgi:N5-(cytidine 5'-diphosphoramidyl)-L-glutamine hydrolase